MRILVLGLCVCFCPPLFLKLARQWAPNEFAGQDAADHEGRARHLRKRFWRGFGLSAGTVFAILAAVFVANDFALSLGADDWLRVIAVVIVLTAALGRGGWPIQTWDGGTTIEVIDRGMYLVSQLGGAALLVFVLTL